ncbi:MAG: helix-turn-helix domain-containing protein [Christensenellales bacterium]|jgi:transcriptional regulator with XRE-family HTH domain
MDQVKIGSFLKRLRNERDLTQEELAEQLRVSSRTISRWETGNNMPDIGMLVEIAEFYEISIPEIIKGERKSENMDQEVKETAVAMAAYSKNEAKSRIQKVIGYFMAAFGIFTIVSALAVFPSESSWGSVYSILGSIPLVIGVYLIIRPLIVKRSLRILSVAGCVLLLFGFFSLTDFVAVSQFHQVPRFRYITTYDSRYPDRLVHKTLFYTVVQKNPGTEYEEVEIVK